MQRASRLSLGAVALLLHSGVLLLGCRLGAADRHIPLDAHDAPSADGAVSGDRVEDDGPGDGPLTSADGDGDGDTAGPTTDGAGFDNGDGDTAAPTADGEGLDNGDSDEGDAPSPDGTPDGGRAEGSIDAAEPDGAVPDGGVVDARPALPSLKGTSTLDKIPVNQFKGLNWGYNRTQPDLGNYSRGVLRLPFLSPDDSPGILTQKTNAVLDAFASAGANTIRLPVNMETVSARWTDYYDVVARTALDRGFKIIFCYWLPASNRLDDIENVRAMFHSLAARYFFDSETRLFPLAFYELANEPSGYKNDGSDYLPDLRNIANYLERDFPGIKRRILVGGTDYSAYPGPVANDPALKDCYLAVHFYDTWAHDYSTTLKGLRNHPKYYDDALAYQISWNNGRIDPAARSWFDRIIMTEFGQWTNRRYGYTSKTTQRTSSSLTPNASYGNDVEGYRISYIFGTAAVVNRFQLGSVMWGGLIEDGYSLFRIASNRAGLTRNDLSTTTGIEELDLPLKAIFWGPRSIDGTYALPP